MSKARGQWVERVIAVVLCVHWIAGGVHGSEEPVITEAEQNTSGLLSLSEYEADDNQQVVSFRTGANLIDFDRYQTGAIASRSDLARWSMVSPTPGRLTDLDTATLSKQGSEEEELSAKISYTDIIEIAPPKNDVTTLTLIGLVFVFAGLVGSGFNRRMSVRRAIGLPDKQLLNPCPSVQTEDNQPRP